MRSRNRLSSSPKLDAKADEAFFLKMRERFARLGPVQLVWRHLMIVASLGIAAWGVSQGWTLGVLLLFFFTEFAAVMVLNAAAIAFLPVELTDTDRKAIRFWKITLPILGIAGGAAYGMGFHLPVEWVQAQIAEHHLKWPLIAILALQLADFAGDLQHWQSVGGSFMYWSGMLAVMRMVFYIAFGVFAVVLGADLLGEYPWGPPAIFLVLSLGADLFAFWAPELAYRSWYRERHGRPAP